jgi:hypothetical protein
MKTFLSYAVDTNYSCTDRSIHKFVAVRCIISGLMQKYVSMGGEGGSKERGAQRERQGGDGGKGEVGGKGAVVGSELVRSGPC